jgi:hypothetical protein
MRAGEWYPSFSMKILTVLLLTSVALAAKKPEPEYQEAVLKSFKTIQAGQHCSTSSNSSGTVSGRTDEYGNTRGAVDTTGNASTNCTPRMATYYTVTIGDQILVLTPKDSVKATAGAMASLGWSKVFAKESCLYGQLPGSHIQIRSDDGNYHIKIGKRESLYKLISAE